MRARFVRHGIKHTHTYTHIKTHNHSRGSDALADIADSLACGDEKKRADLLSRSSVVCCNLSDFASVRRAAKELNSKVKAEDVAAVILNAG